jgi:hypothetical protein
MLPANFSVSAPRLSCFSMKEPETLC